MGRVSGAWGEEHIGKSWNFMVRAESGGVPWSDLHFRNKNLYLSMLFLALVVSRSVPRLPSPDLFGRSPHTDFSGLAEPALSWSCGTFRAGRAWPSLGLPVGGAAACTASTACTRGAADFPEEAPATDSLS